MQQVRVLVDAGDEGLEDAERGSADVGHVYEFAEATKANRARTEASATACSRRRVA